jgi:DNA modification methylase
MTDKNKLYYGDNLVVLREHIKDESVDLIYLDPPFNSNTSYNVLFKEHDGAAAASQIKAFEDTWRWDENAAKAFQETVEAGGQLSEALQAFRKLVGESDMLAYLSMMAPRLREMRRVLKPTGSIYLHCDPTASHYLKLVLDAVFGSSNFRSEIVWKRTSAHSSAKRYGPIHDVILFNSKSHEYVWNDQYTPYDKEYVDSFYRHTDAKGRVYRLSDLTGAGTRKGETGKHWRGIDVTAKGRHWMVPPTELDKLDQEGRIHWPSRGSMPAYIRYLDEMFGLSLQDIFDDIPPIGAQAAERLGYPTQKPVTLLARIIGASSNEGDLVLDPFCGCGTTIDAAQKLKRRWIGIDITHLAINLIRHRLQDTYGEEINKTYNVVGEPTSVPDARVLAEQDPYQFQWWALGLVGARPVEQKKGADKGIDGSLYFHDETGGKTKRVILSVKAGKMNVTYVRELIAVVAREKAQIGVLVSMHPATKPMRAEAADAGIYDSPWGQFPKMQLLTVADLLQGKRIQMPAVTGSNVTFKKARKHRGGGPDQMILREEPAEYGTASQS